MRQTQARAQERKRACCGVREMCLSLIFQSFLRAGSAARVRYSSPARQPGTRTRSRRLEKAEVWEINGQLYVKVLDATRILHEEHLPISLPPGIYRVWQQREYSPRDIRTIRD